MPTVLRELGGALLSMHSPRAKWHGASGRASAARSSSASAPVASNSIATGMAALNSAASPSQALAAATGLLRSLAHVDLDAHTALSLPPLAIAALVEHSDSPLCFPTLIKLALQSDAIRYFVDQDSAFKIINLAVKHWRSQKLASAQAFGLVNFAFFFPCRDVNILERAFTPSSASALLGLLGESRSAEVVVPCLNLLCTLSESPLVVSQLSTLNISVLLKLFSISDAAVAVPLYSLFSRICLNLDLVSKVAVVGTPAMVTLVLGEKSKGNGRVGMNPDVWLSACMLLKSLSLENRARETIVNQGGVRLLIEALKIDFSDETSAAASDALRRCLLVGDNVLLRAKEEGLYMALRKVCRGTIHGRDAAFVTAVLELLENVWCLVSLKEIEMSAAQTFRFMASAVGLNNVYPMFLHQRLDLAQSVLIAGLRADFEFIGNNVVLQKLCEVIEKCPEAGRVTSRHLGVLHSKECAPELVVALLRSVLKHDSWGRVQFESIGALIPLLAKLLYNQRRGEAKAVILTRREGYEELNLRVIQYGLDLNWERPGNDAVLAHAASILPKCALDSIQEHGILARAGVAAASSRSFSPAVMLEFIDAVFAQGDSGVSKPQVVLAEFLYGGKARKTNLVMNERALASTLMWTLSAPGYPPRLALLAMHGLCSSFSKEMLNFFLKSGLISKITDELPRLEGDAMAAAVLLEIFQDRPDEYFKILCSSDIYVASAWCEWLSTVLVDDLGMLNFVLQHETAWTLAILTHAVQNRQGVGAPDTCHVILSTLLDRARKEDGVTALIAADLTQRKIADFADGASIDVALDLLEALQQVQGPRDFTSPEWNRHMIPCLVRAAPHSQRARAMLVESGHANLFGDHPKTAEECPICKDVSSKRAYAVPCMHACCAECLNGWLAVSPRHDCPLCRAHVAQVVVLQSSYE